MVTYEIQGPYIVKTDGENTTHIPVNNGTQAWLDYVAWLEAGNQPTIKPPEPELPPPPAPVTAIERIEALETMLSMVLDQEAGL